VAIDDKSTIPPPVTANLLAEHLAVLIHEAREAGLSDETILAELEDAADALHMGSTG
jgi:hypothetical protein